MAEGSGLPKKETRGSKGSGASKSGPTAEHPAKGSKASIAANTLFFAGVEMPLMHGTAAAFLAGQEEAEGDDREGYHSRQAEIVIVPNRGGAFYRWKRVKNDRLLPRLQAAANEALQESKDNQLRLPGSVEQTVNTVRKSE